MRQESSLDGMSTHIHSHTHSYFEPINHTNSPTDMFLGGGTKPEKPAGSEGKKKMQILTSKKAK